MNAGEIWPHFHSHLALTYCHGGIYRQGFCVIEMLYSYSHKSSAWERAVRLDVAFVFPHTPFGFISHRRDHWHIEQCAGKWARCIWNLNLWDIHLLMLWQLVSFFILWQAMEVDRASGGSCLQALPLSTWLPALSRRFNSQWWAIICGVKVQQVHWLLPGSSL